MNLLINSVDVEIVPRENISENTTIFKVSLHYLSLLTIEDHFKLYNLFLPVPAQHTIELSTTNTNIVASSMLDPTLRILYNKK